jgi:hypothetical protein
MENETWRDRKREELITKQMEMAYEVARISIEIKKLREEPPVPEGSVPLSMIEPLINETVERLMLLKNMKQPKPKRVTRDLILDAIGCPNLIIKRVVHRFENSGHKIGWKFVYLHHDPLTSAIPKSVGELHVDHRKLNDLTLEQWVENGQKLIEEVKMRLGLSDVIETVSPSKTPFMTEGREVNLNEWNT